MENLSELQRKKLRSISALKNVTLDVANNHTRRRRSVTDGLSKWSHGNWCGAYTGGYENHCKTVKDVCKAPYKTVHDKCKQCNPVVDEVDAYCMEHDRYLLYSLFAFTASYVL